MRQKSDHTKFDLKNKLGFHRKIIKKTETS